MNEEHETIDGNDKYLFNSSINFVLNPSVNILLLMTAAQNFFLIGLCNDFSLNFSIILIKIMNFS